MLLPALLAVAATALGDRRSWLAAGALSSALYGAMAARLAGGSVIVAGGDAGSTVSMTVDAGSVLVAGGWNGVDLASAEIYDPGTDTWTATKPMHEAGTDRARPCSRTGACSSPAGTGSPAASDGEPYVGDLRPAPGTVRGPQHAARRRNGVTTLADGTPAISGGFWWTDVDPATHFWSHDRYEDTVELYDARHGTWTPQPRMSAGRSGHVAVALADGSLLVTGGFGAGKGAERLTPPPPTPTPTVTPDPDPAVVPTPAPIMAPNPASTPSRRIGALPRRLTVGRDGRISLRLSCRGQDDCGDRLVLRRR